MPAYENLYRPTYEVIAAAGWGFATAGVATVASSTNMPLASVALTLSVAAPMCLWRAYQAYEITKFKVNLAGQEFWTITSSELLAKSKLSKDALWLGKGFRWTVEHTHRAYQMLDRDLNMVIPPKFVRHAFGNRVDPDEVKGEPWIHGLEKQEEDLMVLLKHLEGNTQIYGATGTGKSRFYETLLTQLVLRKECVIFFDPKGDKELESICKRACTLAGRPEAFLKMHPAFPDKSIRLDPLANFTRLTEIASRLTDILQSEQGDPFVAFAWRMIYNHCAAMDYIGKAAQIRSILSSLESGGTSLLRQVLLKFFSENFTAWQSHMANLNTSKSKAKYDSPIQSDPELAGMVHIYKNIVPSILKIAEIDGFISVVEHPREHTAKMIQSILPLLQMLSAGSLNDLLSPNTDDIDDPRPRFDMGKIVSGRYVLYISTDSLPDSTVGSALGAIYLADAKAVAGQIYNYSDPVDVAVVIDEAAEIVADPLIQILNKGRGAGFRAYLATQTFSDYVTRFGSADKARMAVGNMNNIISFRARDRVTQQFVAENFAETSIKKINKTISSGSKTEDSGMEFSGNIMEQLTTERVEVFPQALLGKLPDLHFMAMIGSKIYKGRIPKVL